MRRGHGSLAGLVAAAAAFAGTAAMESPAQAGKEAPRATRDRGAPGPRAGAVPRFGRFPLLFVENRGQQDARVSFSAAGRDKRLFFTRDGVTWSLRGADGRWTVKFDFVDPDPEARPEGRDPTPTLVSYFKGPRARWKTGLRTFSRVVYPDLWPGIDLAYAAETGAVKYQFLVRPGADPARIRMACRGASLGLGPDGALEVTTPVAGYRDARPVSWQEAAGRRIGVATEYALEAPAADGSRVLGFRLGAYDRDRPLVIDPTVVAYSGLIGGDDEDEPAGIAVDAQGAAYAVGRCRSDENTFPVTVGPDLVYGPHPPGNDTDGFIAKVLPDGSGFAYCGYIGGSGDDRVRGVAVDGTGNAFVIGSTDSDETTGMFPVTVGPDLTYNGGGDAYVAKLNPAGTALLYCGYLGGTGDEYITFRTTCGIAVDGAGSAFVCGTTRSSDLPVAVGPDLTYNGGKDGFVAKVKADGTGLDWCGYLGGSADDEPKGIALDGSGNACVVGNTSSNEATFPVVVGPDLTFNGGTGNYFTDGFVAKVRADGTGLVYCGYLGGSGDDFAEAVAVDAAGNTFVAGAAGYESRDDFPRTVGPMLTYQGGYSDAVVAKVNPSGSALLYCGFIGGTNGSGGDEAYGIQVDASGSAFVAGVTDSDETRFPVVDGPDLNYSGGTDAFVAKVKADASGFDYCGYVGGAGEETCSGLALDPAGNAYIVGYTDDSSFPIVVGPGATYYGSPDDVFVAKISGPGGAAGPIESFILPKKVKAKLDATDPAKSTLVAAGFLDTGPDADPDLGASAELDLGGLAINVPGLVPDASGTKFVYTGTGLLFQVTESKTGSSRAKFKVKYRGDISADVDPDSDLTLQFDNGTVNGIGTVGLEAGGYTLGRKRGALVAPNLYLYKAKATLRGGGMDTLSLKVGLATGGTTPDVAPTVDVGFGGLFSATIASGSFVRNGDRYEFRGDAGGITLVILDYLKETMTVKGTGLDLGAFPAGATPVDVTTGLDGAQRAVRVRLGRKGSALVY